MSVVNCLNPELFKNITLMSSHYIYFLTLKGSAYAFREIEI
jgi:hypothetical protein